MKRFGKKCGLVLVSLLSKQYCGYFVSCFEPPYAVPHVRWCERGEENLPLLDLKRIRIGSFVLGGLPYGEYRELTDAELLNYT